MKRLWFVACLVVPLAALMAGELPSGDSWPQWAKNPQQGWDLNHFSKSQSAASVAALCGPTLFPTRRRNFSSRARTLKSCLFCNNEFALLGAAFPCFDVF